LFTGSSASGSSKKDKDKSGKSGGSGSDTDASLVSSHRIGGGSLTPGMQHLSNLATVPQEVSGSRQSFRMAMGNPCEFFVDVM
jgi:segment polarity protein dishevelled